MDDVFLTSISTLINQIEDPFLSKGSTRDITRTYVGLILLSTAAGAPFLPKLVDVAKGNIAFSVGLMVLLMVVTIIYLPLVLPLLLGDVEVSAWDIAQSLIIMMLIPLAAGLFIKARYEEAAAKIQPTFGMAANIALLTMMVLGLVLKKVLSIFSAKSISL